MSPCAQRSGSPPAMRSCLATRSMPVIISVTGCSTWMRVFISMKKNSPRRVVVEELDRAGAAVADRLAASATAASRRRRARCVGDRARRRAPPPRPSGGGAAASTRARSSAPRASPSPRTCTSMWRARAISLLQIEPAVAEGGLRLGRCLAQVCASSSSAASAMRMPRPPPPAAALIMTGKADRRAAMRAGLGQLADTARRCPAPSARRPLGRGRARRDLVAHAGGCVSAVGPTKISPAASTASAKPRVLGQEAVAGMHRVGAARRAPRPRSRVDVEVGLRRLRRADVHAPRRPAARRATPRRPRCAPDDRRDAELARGADDPHRDLAAVGDEQACGWASGYSISASGWPAMHGVLVLDEEADRPCRPPSACTSWNDLHHLDQPDRRRRPRPCRHPP